MKQLLIITIFFSSLFGWIGEITALKGNGKIIRNNQILPAKIGMKLEQKDSIKTSNDTKMQIVFKDDTVITIGKNSEVKVSDYVFDNQNSKANFRLSHGIMKTLTGKIGKIAPKRFRVRTKNASIGIRGTYFVVESYKYDVKVGMISGVIVFTDLDTMKSYEISVGEQLIFDIKAPQKVVIKKGFVDPYVEELLDTLKKQKEIQKNKETTKIKETTEKYTNQHKQSSQKPEVEMPDTSEQLNDMINDIQNNENSATKDVTTSETPESDGTFTKFMEGLKDLF